MELQPVLSTEAAVLEIAGPFQARSVSLLQMNEGVHTHTQPCCRYVQKMREEFAIDSKRFRLSLQDGSMSR